MQAGRQADRQAGSDKQRDRNRDRQRQRVSNLNPQKQVEMLNSENVIEEELNVWIHGCLQFRMIKLP